MPKCTQTRVGTCATYPSILCSYIYIPVYTFLLADRKYKTVSLLNFCVPGAEVSDAAKSAWMSSYDGYSEELTKGTSDMYTARSVPVYLRRACTYACMCVHIYVVCMDVYMSTRIYVYLHFVRMRGWVDGCVFVRCMCVCVCPP